MKQFWSKNGIANRELKSIRKNLYHHIHVLSEEIGERNSDRYPALEKSYQYILKTMGQSSLDIMNFDYSHDHQVYHNVVAEKNGAQFPNEIIIIGAHYDSSPNSPGADDNASGIAGLLELIRLFDLYENKKTFRFVAFTLEEPPFYGTPQMGSHIYAKNSKIQQENIIGMIALEMLGYYTNKKNSQTYPYSDLAKRYPDRGNFIGIIGNQDSRLLVEKITRGLKDCGSIPVESLVAHNSMPGIDLSDHVSFWKLGYRAIMITDTAYYRNRNYHKQNDTIETLNFNYFSKLILGLFNSLKQLDAEETAP